MKEVTLKIFEKGDFVRGRKGSGYGVTNGDMTRGVVTNVDEKRGTMVVKVLGHRDGREIGSEFRVANDASLFELLPKTTHTAGEDHIMTISVSAEKGDNLVCAVVRYKGDYYGGDALCSPDDEFDFREGAAIAIGRAFDLIDEVEPRGKSGGDL